MNSKPPTTARGGMLGCDREIRDRYYLDPAAVLDLDRFDAAGPVNHIAAGFKHQAKSARVVLIAVSRGDLILVLRIVDPHALADDTTGDGVGHFGARKPINAGLESAVREVRVRSRLSR